MQETFQKTHRANLIYLEECNLRKEVSLDFLPTPSHTYKKSFIQTTLHVVNDQDHYHLIAIIIIT